jgi:hypothetical protein
MVERATRRSELRRGRLQSGQLPFGPPPVIEGEDTATYDELLTRISGAIKPADILEDIWVRDLADCVWIMLRYRRLQASLITATAHNGLWSALEPLAVEGLSELVQEWTRRRSSAIKQVDQLLSSADLSMDAVLAHTLLHNLDSIERLDRMIVLAGARRDAILREIDRHRGTLGHALRRSIDQIEQGEYPALAPTK